MGKRNKYCIFLLLFCLLLTSCLDTFEQRDIIVEQRDIVRFRLFETTNMWTFIRLDTVTGAMWQIQFDIQGDNRGGVELSTRDLTAGGQRIPGRFTLIPTTNMWTFILLDQIDGRTWQVQWSLESAQRFIIPLFQ